MAGSGGRVDEPQDDHPALAALVDGVSVVDAVGLAEVAADDWLIGVNGRGWLEKKRTGGRARYWYQRWRERVGEKTVKRSVYLAPLLGNEGARESGEFKRRS